MSPFGRHHLSADDLTDLAGGAGFGVTTTSLRNARLSRHKLLVEAARRAAGPDGAEAWELLARVQARRPEVVDGVLSLPQASAWAVDSLCAPDPEQGQLGVLAVVAAVRAGEPFDLRLPVGGDALVFPGLGTLRLPGRTGAVRLRLGPDGIWAETGEWSDAPRIRVETAGLTLDVVLESDDLHLARYGAPPRRPDQRELARWRVLLDEAWRLIVANDPSLAADLAADLQVIVPLEQAPGRGPLSATSGWAPGAVGLSLPDDALSLAETLVHEYRHSILGIVEDIVPLVDHHNDVLCYAPWRDDPRPPAGLLHGCFAHLTVTAFWRRQRQICTAESEPCAQRQFARWRHATVAAVSELIESRALTEAGVCLAEAMRETLERWQDEPVPEDALKEAERTNDEHRLRWRLSHLEPDEKAVAALVEDWRAGATAPRPAPLPARIVADRRRKPDEPGDVCPDNEQRTWIDLALAARPVVEPVEVAYAVFERLRRLGASTTPGAVLAWVAAGTFAVVQRRS